MGKMPMPLEAPANGRCVRGAWAYPPIGGSVGMFAVARASCPWGWVEPSDMGKMPMPLESPANGRCARGAWAYPPIGGSIGMSVVARASCPWVWVKASDMGKMPMPLEPPSIDQCVRGAWMSPPIGGIIGCPSWHGHLARGVGSSPRTWARCPCHLSHDRYNFSNAAISRLRRTRDGQNSLGHRLWRTVL
jgi:hypothetical protein